MNSEGMMRFARRLRIVSLLALIVPAVSAQSPPARDRDDLDVTMRVIVDPNAKVPDEIVRRIELPKPAQPSPAPANPDKKPEKPVPPGQQRSSEAREQGREFGQQVAEEAKQRAEEARRNNPPDNSNRPPNPPGQPPGTPPPRN
jgi:hypothetical protein